MGQAKWESKFGSMKILQDWPDTYQHFRCWEIGILVLDFNSFVYSYEYIGKILFQSNQTIGIFLKMMRKYLMKIWFHTFDMAKGFGKSVTQLKTFFSDVNRFNFCVNRSDFSCENISCLRWVLFVKVWCECRASNLICKVFFSFNNCERPNVCLSVTQVNSKNGEKKVFWRA